MLPECSSAISLLSHLEPLAGAGLALNLAYLNLERFRYREKIRGHAKQELQTLGPDVSTVADSQWYRELVAFSGLKDNDWNGAPPEQFGPQLPQPQYSLPKGMWGAVYSLIFDYHQDRRACIAATAICCIFLIVGAGHTTDAWPWTMTNCWFDFNVIDLSFYVAALCMLLPIILVGAGTKIVDWAMRHCSVVKTELAGILKKEAQQADLAGAPATNLPAVVPQPAVGASAT